MAVDWFLIDAPDVVPKEFGAWKAAQAHHEAVFSRCLEAEEGSAEQAWLDGEGQAAQIEADRLEQIARDAWKRVRAATC